MILKLLCNSRCCINNLQFGSTFIPLNSVFLPNHKDKVLQKYIFHNFFANENTWSWINLFKTLSCKLNVYGYLRILDGKQF